MEPYYILSDMQAGMIINVSQFSKLKKKLKLITLYCLQSEGPKQPTSCLLPTGSLLTALYTYE